MSNDSHHKEHNLPRQDARYNKQDLNTALAVIKKIMKMDAAEPFNAPVDPVALGIPNSHGEQGDYFSTRHASARLQMETAPLPSQERLHVKGTNAKYKKRGRHGFHKHKSDCLCAVCVMRRRRREREMNAKVVENRIEISDGNASKEFKQEETPIENHCSEDASSNLGHSPETDADGDLEVQGEEMKLERLERHGSAQQGINEENAEMRKTVRNNYFDQYQLGHGSREEHNLQSQSEEMEDSSIMIQKHNRKDDTPPQEESRQFQKFQQKQIKGQQQTLMSKNLHLNENPTIMELCGTLFPSNHKSAWSGPHSLVCHDLPVRRSSAIHEALEMFMK
ncbi:hypothetical protein IFM89_025169 [Coptis chinensis]|uniref:Uncharacterized protein n=1 Tax=Coptis chinensis TaxID=261450 RepID=A0A835LSU1_9MAGN|nr:hypothetical protein IFM89_025169 [Coptis chinensis]